MTTTKQSTRFREVTSYDLLQVTPASGFRAVYAEMDKDESKPVKLYSMRVDALGVAEARTKRFVYEGDRVVSEQEVGLEREVVALVLDAGHWLICEDDSNFAGLCREGDDITKATGRLSGEYNRRRREVGVVEHEPWSNLPV